MQTEQALKKMGRRVHLIGAGGVGMAGLGYLLQVRGFKVTGCDARRTPFLNWLAAKGVTTLQGHSPDHLRQHMPDWIVRTPAVAENNPELQAAQAAGLPVLSRGQTLAGLVNSCPAIAVCGTHGKTTTSSWIVQLLAQSGRPVSWCIGGETAGGAGVAGGHLEDVLVVEADESDGTLAAYQPELAVVTNIEFDHMEHFPDQAAFEACFRQFLTAAGRVLYCRDDTTAHRLCHGLPEACSYGFTADATYRITVLREHPAGAEFEVTAPGEVHMTAQVSAPGRHQVSNAVAAAVAAFLTGIPFANAVAGIAKLKLPRRRFEAVVKHDALTVLSDYAHHPTEIRSVLSAAAAQPATRRLVVFQPHRYTRTRRLRGEFSLALRGVHPLVLLPVYAASEMPLSGGESWNLYQDLRKQEGAPLLADSLEQVWQWLQHELMPGDQVLLLGAGDVEQLAERARNTWTQSMPAAPTDDAAFAKALQQWSRDRQEPLRVATAVPLGPRTTLRVGGRADLFVQTGTDTALREIQRRAAADGRRLYLLGGGSNLLISDFGVRGVVIRYRGDAASACRCEGNRLWCGAGLSLAALTARAQACGLSGLEFLEGIPGTVGGALRMNAGAFGCEMAEVVSTIRCLQPDGTLDEIATGAAQWGYRTCGVLKNAIALEARVDLCPGNVGNIARRRHKAAERKAWMRGRSTAGSVFRNPDEAPAGRLLDEAGMAGKKIGGAGVCHEHANVICTEPGATASDVAGLMERMRAAVWQHHGVYLQKELEQWG